MARVFRAGTKTHIACYSCLYSTILVSENGGKLVRCGLNGKTATMGRGVSYPSWCELYGINHKREDK